MKKTQFIVLAIIAIVAVALMVCGCTLTSAQYRDAQAVASTAPADPAKQSPAQSAATQALAADQSARDTGQGVGQSLQAIGGVLPPPYGLIVALIGLGTAYLYKRKSDNTDAAAGLVVNSIDALKVSGLLDTKKVLKPVDPTTGTPATTVGDLLDTVQKEAGKALVDKHQP